MTQYCCNFSCHVPALCGYNSACLCCSIIVVGVWNFRPSKEALLFHSCQLLWSYVSFGADCWQGSLCCPRQPRDDKICLHWQADEVKFATLSLSLSLSSVCLCAAHENPHQWGHCRALARNRFHCGGLPHMSFSLTNSLPFTPFSLHYCLN